ncbi:amidohydrolase family protein [Inquilinus limosus]|uniref:amidohydrolase family protein n=1 Tax=Inquilinus limosus TaxID=171674 RepID=UPI00119824E3|nr:amidohydrolase family protein [Inquilinus limosus]
MTGRSRSTGGAHRNFSTPGIASNFPVDKLFSSYDAIFDAFKQITSGFSRKERRRLSHDNAERFYRL